MNKGGREKDGENVGVGGQCWGRIGQLQHEGVQGFPSADNSFTVFIGG